MEPSIDLLLELKDASCAALIKEPRHVVNADGGPISKTLFLLALTSMTRRDKPFYSPQQRKEFVFIANSIQVESYRRFLESKQTVMGDFTPYPSDDLIAFNGFKIVPVSWIPEDVMIFTQPQNIMCDTTNGKNELSIVDDDKAVIVINIGQPELSDGTIETKGVRTNMSILSNYSLSVQAAAKMIGVHRNTIAKWVKQGILPCVKIGGWTRFDESELRKLVESCKRPGRIENG